MGIDCRGTRSSRSAGHHRHGRQMARCLAASAISPRQTGPACSRMVSAADSTPSTRIESDPPACVSTPPPCNVSSSGTWRNSTATEPCQRPVSGPATTSSSPSAMLAGSRPAMRSSTRNGYRDQRLDGRAQIQWMVLPVQGRHPYREALSAATRVCARRRRSLAARRSRTRRTPRGTTAPGLQPGSSQPRTCRRRSIPGARRVHRPSGVRISARTREGLSELSPPGLPRRSMINRRRSVTAR